MRRDVAIVSGYLVRCPLGGYAWQVLHYLWGLRALGFDAFLYEDTAYFGECFDPTAGVVGDDPAAGIRLVGRFLASHGFAGRWMFWDAARDRHHGRTRDECRAILSQARLVVNLAGVNRVPASTGGTKVFVDLDPGVTQIQAQSDSALRGMLEAHEVHFTVGANIGRQGCVIPTNDIAWRPTRPPVALELWTPEPPDPTAPLTTVGRWDERRRDMVLNGELYLWSKRREWLEYLDLPRRTGARFEVAMDVDAVPGDRAQIERHGWMVRDPLALSVDPEAYRQFIRRSRGEFTVAKDLNVRLRSGWFSDRAACYLPAGRPVISQDTGADVSVGRGFVPFNNPAEAARAVAAVAADWSAHSVAASTLAGDWLAADKVLADIAAVAR